MCWREWEANGLVRIGRIRTKSQSWRAKNGGDVMALRTDMSSSIVPSVRSVVFDAAQPRFAILP